MTDISNISSIINKLALKSDSANTGDGDFSAIVQQLLDQPEKFQLSDGLANKINQLAELDDISPEQNELLSMMLQNLPLNDELSQGKLQSLPDLLQHITDKIDNELVNNADSEIMGLKLSDLENIKIGDTSITDILRNIISDFQLNAQNSKAISVVASKADKVLKDLHSILTTNSSREVAPTIEGLTKLQDIIAQNPKISLADLPMTENIAKNLQKSLPNEVNDNLNLKSFDKSEELLVKTKISSELNVLKSQDLLNLNLQANKNFMLALNNDLKNITTRVTAPTVNFTPAGNVSALENYSANLTAGAQPFEVNQMITNKFGVKLDAPVNSLDWSSSLANKVVWVSQQNLKGVDIHINPPELGPIDLKLQMKNDQTTIQFTAQHAAVREALEQAMPKIRELFNDNGLNLTEYDILDQSSLSQNQQKQHNKEGGLAHSFSDSESSSHEQEQNKFTDRKIVSMINIIDYYA